MGGAATGRSRVLPACPLKARSLQAEIFTTSHVGQDEFFLQGDLEREAGMPVSALMDRHKASKLSSSQVMIPSWIMHVLVQC